MFTPSLARFSSTRVPSAASAGTSTGLLADCVRGWRRGTEPFLSVEVSPLLDAGPEPRKYPKHAGCSGSLCKAGVQSRARATPVLCRKCWGTSLPTQMKPARRS